jgi:BirA family biotin operon repressor/biotin-[acetyl-CoA-carboxylase] ligase
MQNITYKNFLIHQFEELESTNKTAFELTEAKKTFDREIILAKKQNAGRGRKDRNWTSPEGNLYFSIILQPQISIDKIPQISFVAAAALKSIMEKFTKNVCCKWPNDILIKNKKCAGILLESKINQKDCEFVILGVGINIDSNPDNTLFPATSLKNHQIEILPLELLEKFLDEFEKIYQNWLDFGFSSVRNLWLNNAFKLKEEIFINLGDQKINGIFIDLDMEGNLILQTPNHLEKITVGDVS